MIGFDGTERAFVRDALGRLGVRRLVLGVHASAFPACEWDTGYGAPLSAAGRRVLEFASALGFDALQLGPSGQVSTLNLSPYDGTIFARNVWSLGLAALGSEEFAGLLPADQLERVALPHDAGTRVEPEYAVAAVRRAMDVCHARLREVRTQRPDHPVLRAFETFRAAEQPWLALNALYEAIAVHAGDDPTRWPPEVQGLFEPDAAGLQRRSAMRATLGPALERSELAQFLCHAQHSAFRAQARTLGLSIWADLQVGFSHRDRFLHRNCFAANWLLGAPPSRTNAHGQPWGYPLLDPDQLEHADSAARRLFELRVRKLLREHDGVRIDHPHGLVCPWVYRASDPDHYHAVRHGARAFDSPDSPDADLSRWAIAGLGDLNPTAHSHFADNRVHQLDDAQVARYSRMFDVLANAGDGRPTREVFAAEVLSTCPHPLQAVLTRHGLGRFRVTQKANPENRADVYRTELAQPEDWLMLGTHDTPPISSLASAWLGDGSAQPRAAYLAERLIADPAQRRGAAELFAANERNLLCASLADLFVSRAENVFVFIGDLFGEREPFNRAGIVHPDNWVTRLPERFESVYGERREQGRALDIVSALRLALGRSLDSFTTRSD